MTARRPSKPWRLAIDGSLYPQRSEAATQPEGEPPLISFYAFGPFPGGHHEGDGLHIGQHRLGVLPFLLARHPDLGLTSVKAWQAFLQQPDVDVRAQHGAPLDADEMSKAIANATLA